MSLTPWVAVGKSPPLPALVFSQVTAGVGAGDSSSPCPWVVRTGREGRLTGPSLSQMWGVSPHSFPGETCPEPGYCLLPTQRNARFPWRRELACCKAAPADLTLSFGLCFL